MWGSGGKEEGKNRLTNKYQGKCLMILADFQFNKIIYPINNKMDINLARNGNHFQRKKMYVENRNLSVIQQGTIWLAPSILAGSQIPDMEVQAIGDRRTQWKRGEIIKSLSTRKWINIYTQIKTHSEWCMPLDIRPKDPHVLEILSTNKFLSKKLVEGKISSPPMRELLVKGLTKIDRLYPSLCSAMISTGQHQGKAIYLKWVEITFLQFYKNRIQVG